AHKPHFEIGVPLVVANAKYLPDLGVLKPRDGLGLAEEAGSSLGPRVVARQDHLQCDSAIEPDLPRLVDNAHPTPANLAQDLESAHARRGSGWRLALSQVALRRGRLQWPG